MKWYSVRRACESGFPQREAEQRARRSGAASSNSSISCSNSLSDEQSSVGRRVEGLAAGNAGCPGLRSWCLHPRRTGDCSSLTVRGGSRRRRDADRRGEYASTGDHSSRNAHAPTLRHVCKNVEHEMQNWDSTLSRRKIVVRRNDRQCGASRVHNPRRDESCKAFLADTSNATSTGSSATNRKI